MRKDTDRTQYPFCLHVENGLTGIPKTCTRNYECWHCAFDQWLEDIEEVSQNELVKTA